MSGVLGVWFTGMLRKFGMQIAIVGVASLALWGLYAHVKSIGRAEAVAEIESKNNKAVKNAKDAEADLSRECARDPDGCLRDAWTRND